MLVGLLLWPIVSHRPFASRRVNKPWKQTLRVMTYNTHRLGMFEKPERNEVIRFLRTADADVICLQEVEVYKDSRYLTLNELKEAMSDWQYTYFDFKVYNSRRQFGNVVFSRYPLLNKKTVPFESRGSISSRCDIAVGGDTLRLIVNHLESNRLEEGDMQVDSLLKPKSALRDRVKQKLGRAGAIRREQAQAVKEEANASPYPVVLAGDFNDIPYSRTYRILSEGMHDTFLESSFGRYGATYHAHGIGVRIDYIFCSAGLTPIRSEVVETDGSDHLPLVSTLAW